MPAGLLESQGERITVLVQSIPSYSIRIAVKKSGLWHGDCAKKISYFPIFGVGLWVFPPPGDRTWTEKDSNGFPLKNGTTAKRGLNPLLNPGKLDTGLGFPLIFWILAGQRLRNWCRPSCRNPAPLAAEVWDARGAILYMVLRVCLKKCGFRRSRLMCRL